MQNNKIIGIIGAFENNSAEIYQLILRKRGI